MHEAASSRVEMFGFSWEGGIRDGEVGKDLSWGGGDGGVENWR